MRTTLCTLFDSLYMDKGLVLYDSLKKCAKDFELYVLCMDEKCYKVLSDIREEKLKPIQLVDVENEKMLLAKSNRSISEYCWTCSSRLVQYILETYSPICCTYIDADMFFYHDPQILVDEMLSAGKSVMMVPHRFTKRNEHLARIVGTYCVEFNCFKNDNAGLWVLNHWHNNCLTCCRRLRDGIHYGDQKYMDEWPLLFPDVVHVCKHPGAGIAPWNIELYKELNPKDWTFSYDADKERYLMLFFHFQGISYVSHKIVKTSIKRELNADFSFIDYIYRDYLLKIKLVKNFLEEKYNINFLITGHPARNDVWWKKRLRSIKVIRIIYNIIRSSNVYKVTID